MLRQYLDWVIVQGELAELRRDDDEVAECIDKEIDARLALHMVREGIWDENHANSNQKLPRNR
jgi:hypothetical protein